jgi:hypothetical protein
MHLSRLRSILVRGELLANPTPASGFPLWLPYGTRVVERFEELYREELSRRITYEEWDPPLLLDPKVYEAAISASIEYRNMYSIEVADAPRLIRPDNLVASASLLSGDPPHQPILMQGSLYRAETGRLRALIRDKHIWSATQVVHHVETTAAATACKLHLETLMAFLRRIAAPSLCLESGPIRDHSKRGLMTVAVPNDDQITLTATLFELARPMLSRLGVKGSLIELGFTTKLLASALALHADEHGLAISSHLSPTQVLVCWRQGAERESAERFARSLEAHIDRVEVAADPWPQSFRLGRRRGVPLTLIMEPGGACRAFQRRGKQGIRLSGGQEHRLSRLLADHDTRLRENGREVLHRALDMRNVVRIEREPHQSAQWHSLGRLVSNAEQIEQALDGETVQCRKKRLY